MSNRALIDASKHGDVKAVQHLLEAGANPSAKNNLALQLASLNGHTEVVRLLLNQGVDPSVDNNVALRMASRYGHTDIVQLLLDLPLERGVDPSAKNNEALRSATHYGRLEVVQLLLDLPEERGVDPLAEHSQALKLVRNKEIERMLKDRVFTDLLAGKLETIKHLYLDPSLLLAMYEQNPDWNHPLLDRMRQVDKSNPVCSVREALTSTNVLMRFSMLRLIFQSDVNILRLIFCPDVEAL